MHKRTYGSPCTHCLLSFILASDTVKYIVPSHDFPVPNATLCVSAVFAVARLCVCLSVCPSVTLVYCIQKAEDIVKLLFRPGSPIILFFDQLHKYPILRGTPSAGAQNTQWVGKMAIYDGNCRLSRKRWEGDKPMVTMER